MSVQHAIILLNTIDSDPTFREHINLCTSYDELMDCLKTKGYQFTSDEFEEAVNHLHVQCQTLENAQLLLQKAEWMRFILFINQKSGA